MFSKFDIHQGSINGNFWLNIIQMFVRSRYLDMTLASPDGKDDDFKFTFENARVQERALCSVDHIDQTKYLINKLLEF